MHDVQADGDVHYLVEMGSALTEGRKSLHENRERPKNSLGGLRTLARTLGCSPSCLGGSTS